MRLQWLLHASTLKRCLSFPYSHSIVLLCNIQSKLFQSKLFQAYLSLVELDTRAHLTETENEQLRAELQAVKARVYNINDKFRPCIGCPLNMLACRHALCVIRYITHPTFVMKEASSEAAVKELQVHQLTPSWGAYTKSPQRIKFHQSWLAHMPLSTGMLMACGNDIPTMWKDIRNRSVLWG